MWMCGTGCGIFLQYVRKVVELQFVVERFPVDAEQLGGPALVVAGLAEGFDDLLLFRLFVAQGHAARRVGSEGRRRLEVGQLVQGDELACGE